MNTTLQVTLPVADAEFITRMCISMGWQVDNSIVDSELEIDEDFMNKPLYDAEEFREYAMNKIDEWYA